MGLRPSAPLIRDLKTFCFYKNGMRFTSFTLKEFKKLHPLQYKALTGNRARDANVNPYDAGDEKCIFMSDPAAKYIIGKHDPRYVKNFKRSANSTDYRYIVVP